MKLIAFAASSSSTSINKALVTYAATLLHDARVEILDLNDFEMPLFSSDREKELGQPDEAKNFLAKIEEADAILISFAEHNGSYSAAYKNLFDWASRINTKVYQNRPMVLLSTSPGKRGGAGVLATAMNSMPHFGGDVRGSFSLPTFFDAFDQETQTLRDAELLSTLKAELQKLR